MSSTNKLNAAREIFEYLYLKDSPSKADLVIGFGHFDMAIPEQCFTLYELGLTPKIVFTGGIGAGTADLGMPEADAFARRLSELSHEFDQRDIIVENKSTNTIENIQFSQTKLVHSLWKISLEQNVTVMLVANPYRQRRVYLTCQKYFPRARYINTPPISSFEQELQKFNSKKLDLVATLAREIRIIQHYLGTQEISDISLPSEIIESADVIQKSSA